MVKTIKTFFYYTLQSFKVTNVNMTNLLFQAFSRVGKKNGGRTQINVRGSTHNFTRLMIAKD